jgi:hypothetical protein
MVQPRGRFQSEDDEAVSQGRNIEASGTIIVRPPLLFVCNHIVFSHVAAMTNYLLPSPPMKKHQPDGENPMPLRTAQGCSVRP